MKHWKKKFSLIELLVVVAIIGVLASLVLPSLSKVREKGQSTVCKNNLKQLGVTMFMYLDDSDRIIAISNFPNDGPWSTNSNFPGDTSLLECPSDPDADPEQWQPSYGFNARLEKELLTSIANPAETLFFADSGYTGEVHPWRTRGPKGFLLNNDNTANAAPIGIRHDYAPNLLWVDGHVSSLNKDVITIHLSDEFWDLD